jgi:hypothetical protein
VVVPPVDGEVAEEIADGEQRASDSPHLSSLVQGSVLRRIWAHLGL